MFKNFFNGIWAAIKSLFSAADNTFVGVFRFIDRVEAAVDRSKQLLIDLKKFDFDPKLKSRVINVPRAIEGFQDLWDEITIDLREKLEQLSNEFKYWRSKFESRTPSEGLEAAAPVSARLQDISTMLDQIATSLETILDIAEIIDDVKHRIETLDDLFLPQSRPRQWLTERTYKRV
jgi:hypothetical protein